MMKFSGIRGYTLLEMAIVIGVVGVFIADGIGIYRLYLRNEEVLTTERNVALAVNAVSNYLIRNGRYPCPARLDARRTDPDYGIEADCTDTSVPAGTCSAGLCIEESERIPSGMLGFPRVRRGAVPFRSLGMPEDFSEDGYHNRIGYAVTEHLAVTETYDRSQGGISVIDDQARSIITPAASAHYVVFSAGPDGAGAYTREGVPHLPCGTGMDSENCNTSLSYKKAVYSLMRQSGSSTTHFDDFLKYYTSVERPLWRVTDSTGTNIRDLVNAESSGGGKVGVGNTAPASLGDTLVISGGGLQANLNLHLGSLCNDTGISSWACFPPAKIMGNDPLMQCPAGSYVKSIHDGYVDCGPLTSMSCPSGQKMIGIGTDGGILCSSFTGCPSSTVPICSMTTAESTRTLPSGGADQIAWTTPPAGFSASDEYLCSNGSWVYQTSSGQCTCTPTTAAPVTVSCDTYYDGGVWTGTGVTTTTGTICDVTTGTETTTSTVTSNDCTCQNQAGITSTSSCSWGFTGGGVVTTSDWVCSSPSSGSYGPSTVTSDCTCAPQPSQTGVSPCPDPDAYSGQNTTQRDWQCPAGTWSNWYITSSTCACTNVTIPVELGCPSGQVGSRPGTKTYDCITNTWSAPVENTVLTTCADPVNYKWRAQVAGEFRASKPSTSNLVNDICSQVNLQSDCYSISDNTYWYYPSCACQ